MSCQKCGYLNTLGNSTLCNKCYYKIPENRVKRRKRNLEYVRKNREQRRRIMRKAHLKRRYGISVVEYDEMAKQQEYKCAICGRPEESHDDLTNKTLCVDHNHKTGNVRGLLCRHCNILIGHMNDEPNIVDLAKQYLLEKDTIKQHNI